MRSGRWKNRIFGTALLVFLAIGWAWTVTLVHSVGQHLLRSEAADVTDDWIGFVEDRPALYRKLAGPAPIDPDEMWLARIGVSDLVPRFVVFDTVGAIIVDTREAADIAVDRTSDPLHTERPFAGKVQAGPVVRMGQRSFGSGTFGPRQAVADVPLRHRGQITAIARLDLRMNDVAQRIDRAVTTLVLAISATFLLMLIVGSTALWYTERQRIRQRREVQRLTHEDIVSGLPNRRLLDEIVANSSQNDDASTAIILLSIDRYAKLAEHEGAQTINRLLQSMALRLKQRIRPGDVALRLTTSEFVVVSPGASPDAALATALRLRAVANEIYSIDGRQFSMTVAAGIAMMPHHGQTEDELIRAARVARNRAVSNGAAAMVFSEEMATTERANAALEADLKHAIENGGLHIAYQPQHCLSSRAVVGFEALCRWTHPEWGAISPGRFIPIAEESDLIMPLGRWILVEACREATTWPSSLKVSVNLSPRQFAATDVVAMVRSALRLSGLPAERLELEITESVLMQDSQGVLDALTELRRIGISIAMDDFGTGYSSLGYLARFPFSKIKLDRSFMQDLEEKRAAFAIVSGVALMGRSLDMRITAEGVETEAQLAKLREGGIDEIQGYLFGRPLEGDDVMRHIQHHEIAPARTAA